MRINAKVDISGLVDKTLKAQKRLVFSVTDGINATAKQIQQEAQSGITKKFKVRKANSKNVLEKQSAIIKPFAKVSEGRLYAEISIGHKPNLLLSGYEDGVKREPAKGSVIAQPVVGNSARKSFSDPILPQFYFRAMALKAKTINGEKKYFGKNGIFTVKGMGVFRRFGSGRRDVELLYHYATDQKLPKKLGWRQAAQAVADKWLDENISRAFLRSLKK